MTIPSKTGQKRAVLITVPALAKDPGGVANYYNAVLPHLYQSKHLEISVFEIGSTHADGQNPFFHRLLDQARLFRRLKTNPPELLHINPSLNLKSFVRDGCFIIWAKLLKIRVLVFFRGWDKDFERRVKGIFAPFFYLTFKRANRFIVLSSEFKERLLAWKIKQPVHVRTTAVDTNLLENFDIDQKIESIENDGIVKILFLSRLEPPKGVMQTLEAFKSLVESGMDLRLSIAGSGSLLPEIKAFIQCHGLSSKIDLLGYVRNVRKRKAFHEHHIYCFPTYHDEGMPNSVLEAMAMGLAIITTPVGGIKDFFLEHKMGILISGNPTSEHLAQTLGDLARDRQKIGGMARFNHAYAKKHFTADRVAKSLQHLYCITAKT